MRTSAFKYGLLTLVSRLSVLLLILVPFQGFLSVWAAHLVGHYTADRLWDEVLLAICTIAVIFLILYDHKIRVNTLSRRLVWVILAYILLNVISGIIAYNDHGVTAKALGYGLIDNLRYLIFFLVTWSLSLRMNKLKNHWQKLVLWPAAIVILFGLLQIFILPHDFLRHFGYGPNTIPVMETINHNSNYIRIASTLRGANPLGAYLIIPITAISLLILKGKRQWYRYVFLLGAVIVLFYSFSRSAWIGTVVSILVLLLTLKMKQTNRKILLSAIAVIVIVAAGVSLIFHNNTKFQNFIFHTQNNSSVKSTSDEGHLSAFKSGLHDVVHNPLGKGTGTAGPASIYNNNKPRIAEDYFIQIGQENGWLGLILYVLIILGIGYLLWTRRADPLALCLFASLIGITLVNLLLYAWSDDTLSYIWWGLAGIAMVPEKRHNNEPKA